ncbi:neugrin [Drosophila hydei]|uniref:Neugrin n=1 Tax=Drosophila hydei TaxID=7224 RepID=A0A6J1MBU0_DROHY|nr:neugrin [Drosophila hydei]
MKSHLIIRSLYTAQWGLLARVPRRANPGMAYQLQDLQQQAADAREDYADNEADFMSAHKAHRQYEVQLQQQRDRVRQFMIKHKYFRDAKLPNFLLYAEKEQMRVLHERDADEWSVDRLAESFPATPGIVQKVLRSKWRPQSVERIRSHDAGVMNNWSRLRAGKCAEVPTEFLQHLQKFAERQRQDLQQLSPEQWPTRPELPVPQKTEFRALLGSKSNKQLITKELSQRAETRIISPSEAEEETYLLDKVKNKRNMRFQDLRKAQLLPQQEQKQHLMERTLPNPSGTGVLPNFVQKFERSEIVVSVEDQRKYEISKVKDCIVIPRKLYRKGATYRVEDVYYDDDGEFLYRVPGMTGGSR